MHSKQNFCQFRDDYFRDSVNRNKFVYLKHYILKNRPERLLDVGSGKGIIGLEMHKHVKEIHGLEYLESNLSEAERFKREISADNVYFQQGDGRKLPFPDNSFDMVVCSQVLEHIENPEEAVREIMRVSKHKVLIDVPTPLWEAWQLSYWSWNKIRNPRRALKRYKEVRQEGNVNMKMAFQPDHVNKWSPWKWKNLIENNGLRITETSSCYMSPIKKFNLLNPIEKKFRTKLPFKYMGMVFFIEAEKKPSIS